ncbi:hypothetical protein PENSPDRAFT_316259 [Peniophora sp. CONT]|nr:hypothetical protein PENSPDRAFT_316259 [Peniophora sp. CONT]
MRASGTRLAFDLPAIFYLHAFGLYCLVFSFPLLMLHRVLAVNLFTLRDHFQFRDSVLYYAIVSSHIPRPTPSPSPLLDLVFLLSLAARVVTHDAITQSLLLVSSPDLILRSTPRVRIQTCCDIS